MAKVRETMRRRKEKKNRSPNFSDTLERQGKGPLHALRLLGQRFVLILHLVDAGAMAGLCGVVVSQVVVGDLDHVGVVLNGEVPGAALGADEGQEDDVGVDAAHEDADDLAVVEAAGDLAGLGVAQGRQWEALAQRRLDGAGGRRGQVAQLVRGADDEGAERARRQLHQVDRDHAPGALHAELLEEGGGDDGVRGRECVGVEQAAAQDADDDDAEAAAEDLRAVAHHRAAGHGAEVRHHLGHRHGVGGEAELVGQHGRVQVLRAVRHEVEAGHEEHQVDEQ